MRCSKCGDSVLEMVDAFGNVMLLSTRTGYEYTCGDYRERRAHAR